MDYGSREDWFDVTNDNIDNIRDKGFFGKQVGIGYKARYEGNDGFTVISKEEFDQTFETGIEL